MKTSNSIARISHGAEYGSKSLAANIASQGAVLALAVCVLLPLVARGEADQGVKETVAPGTGAATTLPTALDPQYKLVWSDEFDGATLDASKWGYRTDSKHLSTQKPGNVSVKDGLLRLTLKKEAAGGKQYTGAGIVSVPNFKYAYYEARMKMPPGAGWHSSFWLMKHDGSGTTDFQAAEQGIVVVQNESVDHLSYAVKLEKYQEPAASYGFLRLLGPDLSADFHVFGCEFTPQAAKFFLDGKLVHSVDASHIAHSDQNLWITAIASHMGNTPKVEDGALPQETQCDYVRVFTKPDGTATAK
jgi:beta-glucanase (GH16 family)